jgi:hypothetical protein
MTTTPEKIEVPPSSWFFGSRVGYPKIVNSESWIITNRLFCDDPRVCIFRIWWISVTTYIVVDWLFMFEIRESGPFRGQATVDEYLGTEIFAMFRAVEKMYLDMDWIHLQSPSSKRLFAHGLS